MIRRDGSGLPASWLNRSALDETAAITRHGLDSYCRVAAELVKGFRISISFSSVFCLDVLSGGAFRIG